MAEGENRYTVQSRCLIADSEIELRLKIDCSLYDPARAETLVLALLPCSGVTSKPIVVTNGQVGSRCACELPWQRRNR